MNRRLYFFMFCMAAVVAVASSAEGSLLTEAGETLFNLPYVGDAFDISAEGNLDWIVVNKNQKDNADIIGTYLDTNLLLAAGSLFDYAGNGVPDYSPAFAYAGGRGDTSATYERADYLYDGTSTNIALPAGSGTLSVWWTFGNTAAGDAHISLNFDDGTSYASPDGFNYVAPRKTVINWQTDTPQTLHFTSDVPAGVWAMAVSQVPEPSALALLGFAFLGLAAYSTRNRK